MALALLSFIYETRKDTGTTPTSRKSMSNNNLFCSSVTENQLHSGNSCRCESRMIDNSALAFFKMLLVRFD